MVAIAKIAPMETSETVIVFVVASVVLSVVATVVDLWRQTWWMMTSMLVF